MTEFFLSLMYALVIFFAHAAVAGLLWRWTKNDGVVVLLTVAFGLIWFTLGYV